MMMMMSPPCRVHSASEGKAANGHRGGSQNGDQSTGVERRFKEMTKSA